jgi:outer membrane cobalamin receptor
MIKNIVKTSVSIIVTLVLMTMTSVAFSQKTNVISGYIEDAASGERLISAAIIDPETRNGTVTNTYGFFSLSITEGVKNLVVSYIGYTPQTIVVRGDTTLTVRLSAGNVLESVEINAKKQDRIENSVQMSHNSIPVEQIKRMPMLLGEADVLKSLQLLPGVKGGTEGTAGIYVRGGSTDQNLFLLDGVPIYNAAHFTGIFSVFNADAIKNVTMIKGGFPARFGGRLSSVVEIDTKEGDKKAFHTEGSIGLLTSKIFVEGPLKKDVASFMVSARRTYFDVLLFPLLTTKGSQDNGNTQTKSKTTLYFYDLNAKAHYKLSDRDNLYLSIYNSRDVNGYKQTKTGFQAGGIDNTIAFSNFITSLKWNRIINNRLFANTIVAFTNYTYSYTNIVKDKYAPNFIERSDGATFDSKVSDWLAKVNFEYNLNNHNQLRFGINSTAHSFLPSRTVLTSAPPIRKETYGQNPIKSLESALYIEDELNYKNLSINGGLHNAFYNVDGANYTSLQPRLGMSYKINNAAIKASYAKMTQYVHLLVNDALGLPTDSWIPTTRNILPEQAQQAALGYASTLKNGIELSVEAYYKTMNNLVLYREGSGFLVPDSSIDNKVTQGKGVAYGFELLAQKKEGRLTGWVSYTLAWNNRQFEDINLGNAFPYKYDRRHELSIVGSYGLNKKARLSASWIFSTGNAITIPIRVYNVFVGTNGYTSQIYQYGSRNGFRTIPTHRLDISIEFVKQKRPYERKWNFGLYNTYNRANPFSYIVDRGEGGGFVDQKAIQVVAVKKQSIIPILPFVSYGFKF